MKEFALVNQSSDASITFAVLQQMADVLAQQQARLAAWWQLSALPVAAAGSSAALPSDPATVVVEIHDSIPEAPGDLAYHSLDALGRPVCKIGWGEIKASGGTLFGPGGLLSAISHELCEARCNPYCGRYWFFALNQMIPEEVCDMVQGSDYEEPGFPGLFVSNFVAPSWFEEGSPGPWDYRGVLTAPLTQLRTGYHELVAGDGTSQNVFGEHVPERTRRRIERVGLRGGQLRTRRWFPKVVA